MIKIPRPGSIFKGLGSKFNTSGLNIQRWEMTPRVNFQPGSKYFVTPAWSRSVRSLPVLTRLIHRHTWMSTNKQDLSLLRRYPWSSVTGRVLSGINPCTTMLFYRKYSHMDGPGLYTVTSVATRYLPIYSRNQHVRDDPEENLNVFNFLCSLLDGPGRRPVLARFVHGLSRITTDHHGLTVRDDPPSYPWMCKRSLSKQSDAFPIASNLSIFHV
jgi:hypothetical protein